MVSPVSVWFWQLCVRVETSLRSPLECFVGNIVSDRLNSPTAEKPEIFPGEVFAETAEFDRGIRQLLPRYDEMLEAIALCVPPESQRILDLGCGTGELSLKLLQRCPDATLVAVDYSARMLEFARAKLEKAGYGDRITWMEADFGDLAVFPESESPGNANMEIAFDACVSSLAIHHLDDEMKQKLFAWVYQHLQPGGCFWNADPVLPISDTVKEAYNRVREQWTQSQGTTLEAVRAKIGRSVPRGHSGQDRLATLEAHLQMLRQAGFEAVDAPWKYFGLAVFGGS